MRDKRLIRSEREKIGQIPFCRLRELVISLLLNHIEQS